MAASETCGSDDERILRVFEWAKKRGTHIHKNLSTGSFPIPGSGDPPKMVRGLMAQVSYYYNPNYYKPIPGSRDSPNMVRGVMAIGLLL